ncbi:AAA-ATPase like [Capsicum annuum]|uniref:AAA-ATPase At3g50940-like n=1 Tax=Capsicum annuum TaxID=4072 RepID=UPI001FB0D338|nr:AAA-ATPase At3g50940-like [Capsicum annuum]
MRMRYSYSLGDYTWTSIKIYHSATFDILAIDRDIKEMIVSDMERFVKIWGFYKKVGKAWKRDDLLYGPLGTEKSSLIAAMTNYLNFDIYYLDLTDIHTNLELRKNRKAEDQNLKSLKYYITQAQTINIFRKPKAQEITLLGLLNFIDGWCLSCGDERIIVFTTNHKDRLDPALLRPGRMDMHIHMS